MELTALVRHSIGVGEKGRGHGVKRGKKKKQRKSSLFGIRKVPSHRSIYIKRDTNRHARPYEYLPTAMSKAPAH